jgi:Dyp-type peroxidase family
MISLKVTSLQGITDLTVLAKVRSGFVEDAFTPVTQLFRLQTVLKALNAMRKTSREALLHPSPYSDAIGLFRGIHFFSFSILEPESADPPPHLGAYRLLLNVTFDGGLEPYIRVIWGPLGTLLDLIFCHCVDYPLAFKNGFQDYIAWVRNHQMPSTYFYADSGVTVADQQYLELFEAAQRESGGCPNGDARCTRLALPGQPPAVIPTPYAVQTATAVLKALDRLRPMFPAGAGGPLDGDAGILIRFTQDLLRPFRAWIEQGLFEPGQRFDYLRAGFSAQRPWLMQSTQTRSVPPVQTTAPSFQPLPQLNPAAVQAGIAGTLPFGGRVVHGALVLLRIADPGPAGNWLATFPVSRADGSPGGEIVRNLALTYRGLVALGVPQATLDKLPREFVDGMEARAGILGDVRGNHPQSWNRPRRNWAPPQSGFPVQLTAPAEPIELSAVHMLMQLRTAQGIDEPDTDGVRLLSRLDGEIGRLVAGSGLVVLSVQAMRQNAVQPGEPFGRNNFGFVDGISQPTLQTTGSAPVFWDDTVKTGELFLGYANGRGDRRVPIEADTWLDNGSFLVVRKLRQYDERLQQVVDRGVRRIAPDSQQEQDRLREVFLSKMLGRRRDGTPLAVATGVSNNDFDYRYDGTGAICPFAAHTRRANPREPKPEQMPPRIARRGMSYGPLPPNRAIGADYGLMFMCYNASIAEQFEVIQRWIAGGNSSGVSSAQSDPFLGVPETGRPRVFRFLDEDEVRRLDLGDEPLVELEWGLYAFVPSIDALEAMNRIGGATPDANQQARHDATPAPGGNQQAPQDAAPGTAASTQSPTAAPLSQEGEKWQRLLEDDSTRESAWAEVRNKHRGVLDTGYGVLVGSKEAVLEVLKDDGQRFSVGGYGVRMGQSIGLGYLGQDDAGACAGHELPNVARVNSAIESVKEPSAYVAALNAGQGELNRLLAGQQTPAGSRMVMVDLTAFAGAVTAELCRLWFGLPDKTFVEAGMPGREPNSTKPLCPGNWLAVSRYVFSPHPWPFAESFAKPQGQALFAAVRAYLASNPTPLKPLTQAIVNALPKQLDQQARIVAGVILGIPATLLGNLLTVLMAWIGDRSLWERQQELLGASPPDYQSARRFLRDRLLATMSRSPVPYMDWRTVIGDTETICGVTVQGVRNKTLVVGLGSAMQEAGENSRLMFGGSTVSGDREETVHACPGYEIAVGAMLGSIAALVTAGTLRSTDDPTELMLIA